MNASFAVDKLFLVAEGQIKGILDFYKAINWKEEPWLMGLVIIHVMTFACILITRKHTNIQAVLFLIMLCVVLCSEKLNELGEKHWRKFSKEQYFDSQGIFITAVLSAPILFNCFLMMLMWLYTASKMLIVVGRGKVKEKRRQMAQSNNETKKEN